MLSSMMRTPDINSENMPGNKSHVDGRANGADDASSFPQLPPTRWGTEEPLSAAPPRGQMTRTQVLARLRRGEGSSTMAKPMLAAENDTGETSMRKMLKGRANGAEAHIRHEKSEETSSQAAAPLEVTTCSAASVIALHGEGSRNPAGATADGVDTVAASEKKGDAPQRGRRRHNRGTKRADDDAERNDAPGGSAGSVCDGDSGDEGSDSTSPARSGSADGANTAASSTHPIDVRVRRCVFSTRQTGNALPRMMALQRSFEAEARYLYEYCGMHLVEWPTLAVEWIPDRAFVDPKRGYTLQYLAIGTQVHPFSGAANTAKIMEVAVPVTTASDAVYGLDGDDAARAEAADFEVKSHLDPGKRFSNVKGHFHCEQSLTMDAAVLKIRAMPAETNIIAVKTASAFIGVYNLVQDLAQDETGQTVPDAVLRGHQLGGFGLCWNTLKPGFIASSADDGYVNYYDVSHRLTIDMRDASAVDPALAAPET
ncbi:hypothetical protein GH5_02656 [Leishmania sp. Ghana 2012 LV757]|uniref:hypothetical protein n=1 Tax=Leishmania sp. Ghana 2012 LV757 TaxID=2803181 RepID=UPI001B67ABDE|nr:hypothetical protein GH5_02656 [Leishmania sp. Ghana 2012 LV757]